MDPETHNRFRQKAQEQMRRDKLLLAFFQAIRDDNHASESVREAARELVWELE